MDIDRVERGTPLPNSFREEEFKSLIKQKNRDWFEIAATLIDVEECNDGLSPKDLVNHMEMIKGAKFTRELNPSTETSRSTGFSKEHILVLDPLSFPVFLHRLTQILVLNDTIVARYKNHLILRITCIVSYNQWVNSVESILAIP